MVMANSGAGALPWTGERFVPEVDGEVAVEHLHRYAYAAEFAANKAVLDVACGEGYGSAKLATVARSVIGIDSSAEAIAHATAKYGKDDLLRFSVGTCSSLPIKSGSIDLVVSFETIEHHDGHEEMLTEIKRVLRPSGVLVLSTPDRNEYSVLPRYSNPYHVKELSRNELESLVARHFRYWAIAGQRVLYGSTII